LLALKINFSDDLSIISLSRQEMEVSMSVNSGPSFPRQYPYSQAEAFNTVYNIGVSTGTGALAGWAFGIIHPVGGAIFGASYALTNTFAHLFADKFCADRTALKTAVWVISFMASISVGIFATTVAGFSLNLFSGVGMVLAMIVTSIAAQAIPPCIAGATLVAKERYCP
jgi:hypothetical protein